MNELRYYNRLAAAYVRGHALRTGNPVLGEELLDEPLEALSDEQIRQIIAVGQEAELKIYRFKTTHGDMPRIKKVLGKHSPFVWNATNLSSMIREKQISLFEQYHARVRIVFLETSWEKNLERNCGRPDEVPEQVIGRMLKNLEIPERWEARAVEWRCV